MPPAACGIFTRKKDVSPFGLDGIDGPAAREESVRDLLDNLDVILRREPAIS